MRDFLKNSLFLAKKLFFFIDKACRVCYNTTMSKAFLDTPICVKSFHERTEKEFRLMQIGYHDLRYIRPFKFFRNQEYYTIHIVLSGKGYLTVSGKEYTLEQGDIFVLPPDEFFMYYADDDDPWEYVFFVFDGTFANEYLTQSGFSLANPIKKCTNLRKTVASFTEFFEKQKNDLPTSYFEAISLLYLLMQSALDKHSELLGSSKGSIVDEAISLIKMQFYDDELTVQSIAETLHFSHSQLCRQFKEKMGMTMIAYINELRMCYAEELFRTTSFNAAEIAYMSGFKEYTYFLMQFKRRNNMTTMEYRNQLKQD